MNSDSLYAALVAASPDLMQCRINDHFFLSSASDKLLFYSLYIILGKQKAKSTAHLIDKQTHLWN